MAGILAITLAKQAEVAALYCQALSNLMHMTQKPAKNVYSRGGTAIDEIVLHGTESKRSQAESADYIASANDAGTSIHYWIGRDFGILYAMVPEEKAAGHAGNPDKVPGVQDHNYRSVGIEMYQLDISMFPRATSRSWISPTGSTTRSRCWCTTSATARKSNGAWWWAMHRSTRCNGAIRRTSTGIDSTARSTTCLG